MTLTKGHGGLAALVGAIVVIENAVSSLFNSHLFDFTQRWLYVFGRRCCGMGRARSQRKTPN